MNKTIHVKAYTRNDGTQVKEHYRNITTYENFQIDNGADTEKRGNDPASIGKNVIKWGLKTLQIALKLRSLTGYIDDGLKSQLGNAVQNLKETYVQSEKLSQKYLDKLVETKDKVEYENLLKALSKQKEINAKAKFQIAKIEYCAENNDYDSVIDELNNYRSNFDEVVKKIQEERPLDKEKLFPVNEESPSLYKAVYDVGTKVFQSFGAIDNAEKFWKASSYNFAQSKGYIKRNGSLVYSVSELPTKELQQTVRKKLQEQIGKPDAIGVIFYPHSRISNAISNSFTLREYFQEHANQLLNGQIIEKGSMHFDLNKNFDLFATYGYADILYAHINSNGDFCAIVFDTYDFNKDENKLIEMARIVQEANLAQKYYTLSIVFVPMAKWQKWSR